MAKFTELHDELVRKGYRVELKQYYDPLGAKPREVIHWHDPEARGGKGLMLASMAGYKEEAIIYALKRWDMITGSSVRLPTPKGEPWGVWDTLAGIKLATFEEGNRFRYYETFEDLSNE